MMAETPGRPATEDYMVVALLGAQHSTHGPHPLLLFFQLYNGRVRFSSLRYENVVNGASQ